MKPTHQSPAPTASKQSVLDTAEQTIPASEPTTLSARDWQHVMAALENPPPPNPRLRAAFTEHHETQD